MVKMGDKVPGMEASAVSLLKRAVELDGACRFTEAMVCYQEGIQLLMDVLKTITNEHKKQGFRDKIKEYMGRAEQLKQHIEEEKESGKYHEQIQIEDNATGFSYEKILGRFLDPLVTEVVVEDPYIRAPHQVYNMVRFCELLVKSRANVKTIKLTTSLEQSPDAQAQQQHRLGELRQSLQTHSVSLEIQYSPIHDREIRLNNGWIIKIGRGLDIYKATQGKFVIGYCDMDLRQCHKTTVDIFHSKHTKT